MTKLNDLQLTDEEMREALPYVRALADTATEKAVRGVALWLRTFGGNKENRRRVARGVEELTIEVHFIDPNKVADALEAMLAEEKAHA
mgnify:CR=1 FL=1